MADVPDSTEEFSHTLADGSIVRVDYSTFKLLQRLATAADCLALGLTSSLTLAEFDTEGRKRAFTASVDGQHADKLAACLGRQATDAMKIHARSRGKILMRYNMEDRVH